jgi:hypothetical protein
MQRAPQSVPIALRRLQTNVKLTANSRFSLRSLLDTGREGSILILPTSSSTVLSPSRVACGWVSAIAHSRLIHSEA